MELAQTHLRDHWQPPPSSAGSLRRGEVEQTLFDLETDFVTLM